MTSEAVRRHFEALAEAAAVVGSVQVRNRATIAGNICNASPAADTAVALLAHWPKDQPTGPLRRHIAYVRQPAPRGRGRLHLSRRGGTIDQ